MNRELKMAKNLSDKHLMLFLLMNEWVKVKQQNKSVEGSLAKQGYKRIGIYGMSYAGQRLCDELMDTTAKIVCCMDQKSGGTYRGYEIIPVKECPDEVEVVIVTPIFFYDEIRQQLERSISARIISLEEVIYGLSES
mgnify:CR=1 FL=1